MTKYASLTTNSQFFAHMRVRERFATATGLDPRIAGVGGEFVRPFYAIWGFREMYVSPTYLHFPSLSYGS